MAFPLAHPAAVLPLRRFCPQRLDFPALVIGSMVPDLGYAFSAERMGEFSHRLVAGAFLFCLPVGFLVWLAFDRVREHAVAQLPLPYRATLSCPIRRQPWPPWIILISLLVGIWTHWLLDGFTHWNGWFVQHVPYLSYHLCRFGHVRMFAFDCLYYLCTFLGTFCVAMAYLAWLQRSTGSVRNRALVLRCGSSVLVSVATVAIALETRRPPTVSRLLVGLGITLLMIISFAVAAAGYFRKGESTAPLPPTPPIQP
jgi:hypothetical protein